MKILNMYKTMALVVISLCETCSTLVFHQIQLSILFHSLPDIYMITRDTVGA